jgi:hypothetical protein
LAGKAQPAGAGGPVAVQRTYDLAIWLIAKVEKFPRSLRFSLGERLIGRSLDLLEALASAAYAKDKMALLERANLSVTSLRFLLRMSFDLKLMGSDSQEFASAKLEEIGRMIGGWRKSLERPKTEGTAQ